MYAFAFMIGTIFIYNKVYNSSYDRGYTSGDVLSTFFGVIFGMFSLGMLFPNLKSVAEGKAAAKLTYGLLDRKLEIQ